MPGKTGFINIGYPIMDEDYKLPRIFKDHNLQHAEILDLASDQAHYFNNVLRSQNGTKIRVFNGHQGEWLGELTNLTKKSGQIEILSQLKPQPEQKHERHLIFAPFKKNRMDFMIEKVVELGVTDLHPVLTQNTEVRKINEDRVKKQILEAAEQCERFFIPTLHTLEPLNTKLDTWSKFPIYACLERFDAPSITQFPLKTEDCGILIGPEGGFTQSEKEIIAPKTQPVSLGETVFRVETAAILGLAFMLDQA